MGREEEECKKEKELSRCRYTGLAAQVSGIGECGNRWAGQRAARPVVPVAWGAVVVVVVWADPLLGFFFLEGAGPETGETTGWMSCWGSDWLVR